MITAATARCAALALAWILTDWSVTARSGTMTNATVSREEVPPHAWRSPDLGTPRMVETDGGPLAVFDSGDGPAIVLAHGWLANANLWRRVVARLSDRFRCLTLDLPLGSHRAAMRADADLTPRGCARLIEDVLDRLDLHDVTLVGNDSGGAYSQIATAAAPERVGRLVLNSCETPRDVWPPAAFTGLKLVAETPEMLRQAMEPLRQAEFRADERAYGLLVKRPIESRVWDTYALPCLVDDGVVRDASKAIRSASEVEVQAAAAILIERFDGPVLLAWSPEDRLFPIAHAEEYSRSLRRGRVAAIADAYSFTPEDQPERLADIVAAFAGEAR